MLARAVKATELVPNQLPAAGWRRGLGYCVVAAAVTAYALRCNHTAAGLRVTLY
eukprot:COSAG01_NODE_5781_length_4035_cov_128.784553_5_plen_54_part_00